MLVRGRRWRWLRCRGSTDGGGMLFGDVALVWSVTVFLLLEGRRTMYRALYDFA